MRLVTFSSTDNRQDNRQRAGALIQNDSAVVDLQRAFAALYRESNPALTNVLALIEAGDEAQAIARDIIQRAPTEAIVARSDVHLHAPIQPPPQMRDCSCFELHLQQCYESARRLRVRNEPDPEAAYRALDTSVEDRVLDTFRKQPIYYKCNRFATIGTDDDVIWPSYCRALDFELEWGCYIGKKAKDITAANARDYIIGYTIFNDMSARDAQGLEMPGQLGPAKGKDFDTANVMGPCLVTLDEIGDPYDLEMIARVNGEEWGRGNTGSMYWNFEQVIEHISRSETLYPGEFLGSGTVGNGCGLERMRYLKPNDVIELEIAKLGILRSRVTKPAK